jgi:hypothetical protein
MTKRTLSVHQEHELLLKLGQAGLTEADAQAIIVSPNNSLAHQVLELVRNGFDGEWFTFMATELTIRELLEQNPDLFYKTREAWWWNEPFATEKGGVRQLQLRTSAVPNSFGKTWDEQRGLVTETELAAVRDVVDGMVQYFRKMGRRLFPDFYVRCKDVSTHGRHVNVGNFDSSGLFVGSGWDEGSLDFLGLASARNSS